MSVVQKLPTGTWRRYSADDGGYYYHNEETDQSIWDPPEGWVEDGPGGPGVAMDNLGPDGKNVPRSNSQLGSPVGDKPNRPSREASDTTMSPTEIQSMKREAGNSSVSVNTPAPRQQQQYQQPKNYNQDDEGRPLCACCAGCSGWYLFGCCVVFVAIATVVVLASVLTLPQTISCDSKDKGYFVILYDGPNLTSVTPNVVCTLNPTNITLNGTGFIKFNSELPTVTWGSLTLTPDPNSFSGCQTLSVRKQTVEECTGFTVLVPAASASNSLNSTLSVTNPYDSPHPAAKSSSTCTATSTSTLLVHPPNVTQINPNAVCQSSFTSITIVGGPFLQFQQTPSSAWVKPSITLSGSSIPPNAIQPTGCTSYSLQGYTNAQTCTQLTVQIQANLYAPSNPFQVQNPQPNSLTGCSMNQTTASFYVLPPNSVTSAWPNALCWKDPSVPVTLYGTFIQIDGQNPSIMMDGVAQSVLSLANCTVISTNYHNVQLCQIATVNLAVIDRSGFNSYFYLPVISVSPPPAIPASSCTTNFTPIATFPSPVINPVPPGLPALCSTGPDFQTVTIGGSFLVFNNTKPNFSVGGYNFASTQVNPINCNPILVPGFTVSLCTGFTLTVPNGTAISAPSPVTVSYPQPLTQCAATSPYPIFVASPPTLTSVVPLSITLSALPQNLTLTGTFQTYNSSIVPTVQVGNTIQRNVTSCGSGTPQSCTTLIVTFNSSAGLAPNTAVPLSVITGSCTSASQIINILP